MLNIEYGFSTGAKIGFILQIQGLLPKYIVSDHIVDYQPIKVINKNNFPEFSIPKINNE